MPDIRHVPGSNIFGMQILLPGILRLAGTPSNRSNSYQPEKTPSNLVGARVAERGRVGLYGRPPWVAQMARQEDCHAERGPVMLSAALSC